MIQLTRLPTKEKYFPGNPVPQQPASNKLFVAHYNRQITAAGRATTIYRVSDDTNDAASAGSFFLVPDPYYNVIDSDDNNLYDFIEEEEEMMLFDQPPITSHSLYKI